MTTATHQLSYCWITDALDTEHAVTYDHLARAVVEQHGHYRPLCDIPLYPAALTATPKGRCSICRAKLQINGDQLGGRHRAN